MKKFIRYFLGIIISFGATCSAGLCAEKELVYENEQIKVRLFPRTPNQMAGFYEAREFPSKMVNVLTDFCVMTVVVHNKTKDVFWMDLENWKFISDAGEVKRIHRNQWPPRWKRMKIQMASQSTFRWTLLPETLEFFPDEGEGGNVIFVKINGAFSLQASFAVGKNKDKGRIMAHINNLQCAQDDLESTEEAGKP
ncbi:MAG: hypothetical protein KAU29_12185 [Gammaproteobacteria bacterium]|nr:hypothetical protein [Gammaproteobacteria bacterium]